MCWAAVGIGISTRVGTGTVINPMSLLGLYGDWIDVSEIQSKCFKYGVGLYVIVVGWILRYNPIFNFILTTIIHSFDSYM